MGNGEWAIDDEDAFSAGFSEDDSTPQIRDHRDLIVWQAGMTFAQDIYGATASFPGDELYGLTSQLRRAAVSISSNIAEGYGRETTGAYMQFLRIAQGSAREAHSLLELSRRLGLLAREPHELLESQAIRISKMLRSLIRSLERKLQAG